jgi:RNA polymerase sigma-32 factor
VEFVDAAGTANADRRAESVDDGTAKADHRAKSVDQGTATKVRAPRRRAKKAVVVEVADRPSALVKADSVEKDEDTSDERPVAEVGEIEPPVDELEDISPDLDTTAIVSAKDSRLSRRDPLAAYMAEVNRHALLTREEETELARQFRDNGDVKAAYKLVAANLRLVVKLAHQYHRNPMTLLDLVQEGNMGLMQAVKKYDPERGVKLSSYAAWWIRAYILRYIMDNWKMVKLGTTEAQRKLFFKLRQEQEQLVSQGFEATPKLLAERLNVSEQDVLEMDQRLGHDEVSLDAPLTPDESQTRADRLLPSNQVAPDVALGNQELKKLFHGKLNEFAATLNEKERFIFERRLIADDPMTLQDIGTHYGVSRERARQIEAAMIERMRAFMRTSIPDFDLVAKPEA